MAKANNTTSVMFFNVALMLSLLLIISMAEARLFGSKSMFTFILIDTDSQIACQVPNHINVAI